MLIWNLILNEKNLINVKFFNLTNFQKQYEVLFKNKTTQSLIVYYKIIILWVKKVCTFSYQNKFNRII